MRKDLAVVLRCVGLLAVGLLVVALATIGIPCISFTSTATAAGDTNATMCGNEAHAGFSVYLPDCRAYEMVTPSYKQGYPIHPAAIAEDGTRIVGWSLGAFAGVVGAPQPRVGLGTEYELARGASGWQVTALAPTNSQFQDASSWYTTSSDVTKTLWSMPTAPVGEDDYYIRDPSGRFNHVGPLTAPSHGPTNPPAPPLSGPTLGLLPFEGASSDLSAILYAMFVTNRTRWPGDETQNLTQNLYEYAGTESSEPEMVAVTGEKGSKKLISLCGVDAGGPQSKFNVISADGETVFFTPRGADVGECGKPQPPVDEVYARLHESETVILSAHSPVDCTTAECESSTPADALFQGASRDGSKAFFSSTQQLVDQATEDPTPGDSAIRRAGEKGCPEAHESGCNLYEYDFDNQVGENLVLVSGGSTSPHVQGVARISQDGSHVYFIAQGVLTSSPNNQGQTAQLGEDNLYVFERDAQFPDGKTSFIATVAPNDERLWGSEENGDLGRPVQTTSDGRFLVFQSHASLTSDDTSSGVWQVFEYDAQTGDLVRISKGQNGFNNNGNTTVGDATIPRVNYIPGAGGQMPQKLALSDDGAFVYFQSPIGLTPQALDNVTIDEAGNKANNVYEYHDGEVYLITTGKDVSVSGDRTGSNVNLLGGSASGSDIFFTAGEQIVSEDVDSQQDIYDARINGGFPPAPPSAPCSGEGCLGPLSGTPSLLASASATQLAGENAPPETPGPVVKPKTKAQIAAERLSKALKACRAKHNRNKRRSCEKAARKRHDQELHPKARKARPKHASKAHARTQPGSSAGGR